MYSSVIYSFFRQLKYNRLNSAIIVIGLSLGLSIALLCFQYIISEVEFNKSHENRDRIGRIYTIFFNDYCDATSSFSIGKMLKDRFPEIEKVVTYRNNGFVSINENKVQNFFFANQDFFEVFTVNIIKGDKKRLLIDPNSVVLSETSALMYFNKVDIIGNSLEISIDGEDYFLTITGVFEDLPGNNSLIPQFIGSINVDISYLRDIGMGERADNYDYWNDIFLLLTPEADFNSLSKKINQANNELGLHERIKSIHLQKFDDIYFHSNNISDRYEHGNLTKLILFGLLGVIIILVAVSNYILLFSVINFRRGIEVCIRKVYGCSNILLFRNTLIESMLFITLSLILGLLLSRFIRPVFTVLIQNDILVYRYFIIRYILCLFFGGFIISLVSSSIIYSYLLKFNPIRILRNQFIPTKINNTNLLMFIQIAVFLVLFSFTMIINRQLNSVLNSELGFDFNEIVYVDNFYIYKRMQSFTQEIQNEPDIVGITSGYYPLPMQTEEYMEIDVSLFSTPDTKLSFIYFPCDYGFIDLFNIELISGLDFDMTSPSEAQTSVIINETAVEELGLNNPVEQYLRIEFRDSVFVCKIIGVVKNFHYTSFHEKIKPFLFKLDHTYEYSDFVFLKIDNSNIKEGLNRINTVLRKFIPEWANEEIRFVESNYYSLYESEIILKKVIKLFSAITIFIICCGLYGHSAVFIRSKLKQLAIHKVFGANPLDVTLLILRRYFLIIGISSLLAIPIIWKLTDLWLNNFAIKVYLPTHFYIQTLIITIILITLPIILNIIILFKKNPIEFLAAE